MFTQAQIEMAIGPCPVCGSRIPRDLDMGHPDFEKYIYGRLELNGFCSRWHENGMREGLTKASIQVLKASDIARFKGIQDVWMGLFQYDYKVDGYWVDNPDRWNGYWISEAGAIMEPRISDEMAAALDDPEAEDYEDEDEDLAVDGE
jgi:hypothetical protein